MNQKEKELMMKYVQKTKSSSHLREIAFKKIGKFNEELIPMKRYRPSESSEQENGERTSQREKKKRKLNFNRKSTVTIAFPGSILEDRKKNILRENLVSHIARSASIFQVDEIVVFNEYAQPVPRHFFSAIPQRRRQGCFEPNVQTANILYFLDCPPFLRSHAFPLLPELSYCGTYHPLITPNHLNRGKYREGVYTGNSVMYLGEKKKLILDKKSHDPNIELIEEKKYTLEITGESQMEYKGKVVHKLEPRTKNGQYFGYSVRIAESLSKVWSECPFESGGYDVTIGTSVEGNSVDSFELPLFKHLLIVFGSPKNGLTHAVECDQEKLKFTNERELFNFMLNICPDQGTKTIRTEEAITIGMSSLRPYIQTNRAPKKNKRPFIPLKQ